MSVDVEVVVVKEMMVGVAQQGEVPDDGWSTVVVFDNVMHFGPGMWGITSRELASFIANDDGGDSGGARVLLGTGVNQTVFAHWNRSVEKIRRAVADKRGAAGIGLAGELYSLDRFVGAGVDVGGARVELELALFR